MPAGLRVVRAPTSCPWTRPEPSFFSSDKFPSGMFTDAGILPAIGPSGSEQPKACAGPCGMHGLNRFRECAVYDSVWPQTVPSVGGVPKIWQGPLAMEFSSGLPLKAFSFVFCFSYREAMRSSCHANVEQGSGRAVVLPAWNARHIMPQRQFDLPASCRCWSATFDAILSLPHPWWL